MRERELDRLFLRWRDRRDLAALGRVFDVTARELLEVAAHLVRDTSQAEDLVQATFLAAIENAARYDGSRSLVPWLVGILTREARLWNRRAARRVEPDRLDEREETCPAIAAERAELSARVLAEIERVPEPYREVLLRTLRDGASPREIARQLDRAPGTVRVQVHRGLEMLRKRLPAGLALGAAALLGARGLAAVREGVLARAGQIAPAAAGAAGAVGTGALVGPLVLGGIAVKNLALAAAVVAALLVGWIATRSEGGREEEKLADAPAAGDVPAAVTRADDGATDLAAASQEAGSRVAAGAPAASATPATPATTGSLRVRVRWGDDGSAAPDVLVELRPYDPSRQDEDFYARSDARGEALFEALQPATYGFQPDRCSNGAHATVRAGEETLAELIVPDGVDVDGRVVDDEGAPVAGAEVAITSGRSLLLAHPVAVSDADGRFSIRCAEKTRQIGARASGHAPSTRAWISDPMLSSGGRAAITLTVPRAHGRVAGRVLDAAGMPIAGARLRIGGYQGPRDADDAAGSWVIPTITASDGSTRVPPNPSQVASDAQGRFSAPEVELGRATVQARASGFASWTGEAEVVAGETAELEVRLERSASLSGTVRRADGTPAARCRVRVDGPGVADTDDAWCDAQGRYAIADAPCGELTVIASLGPLGQRTASTSERRLRAVPGERVVVDLALAAGLAIRGSALDERGEPLAGWQVHVEVEARPWVSHVETRTDARGAFAFEDCADAVHVLRLREPEGAFDGNAQLTLRGVRPGSGDLVLRLDPATRPSAYFEGTVVDASGAPLEGATVSAWSPEARHAANTRGDARGRFRLGPLSPGRWQTSASAPGHPPRRFEERQLGAGEVADLGTIALSRGGRMIARVRDASGAAPVDLRPDVDGTGVAGTIEILAPDRIAALLAPGRYALRVEARGCAAARVPFEVEAGEPTELDVVLAPGSPCRVLVSVAEGGVRPTEIALSVRDARGEVLVRRFADATADGFVLETALAPGEYELRANDASRLDGVRGSATASVRPGSQEQTFELVLAPAGATTAPR